MKPVGSIKYDVRANGLETMTITVVFDNATHWGCGRCGDAHEKSVRACPGVVALEPFEDRSPLAFPVLGRYARG